MSDYLPERKELEVTLDENDSLKVTTPQGIVYVSCLAPFGTSVTCWDNPETNPVGMIHMKKT